MYGRRGDPAARSRPARRAARPRRREHARCPPAHGPSVAGGSRWPASVGALAFAAADPREHRSGRACVTGDTARRADGAARCEHARGRATCCRAASRPRRGPAPPLRLALSRRLVVLAAAERADLLPLRVRLRRPEEPDDRPDEREQQAERQAQLLAVALPLGQVRGEDRRQPATGRAATAPWRP